ncbi:STAS domain-containing protein [Rhizobium sp. C4]|uniref:STAS domain-containing protein n=1 Tax=Rhizobium sp. C4 TaxID=1349800 RepID=UPI001E4834C2|nr:STAS domain-containing protein [Rhizobium sp. C4]MCD2172415.1 STAS domain-containing protein [Rhizobium sp. C4]
MKTETAALSLNGPLTIKTITGARDILQAFIGENAQRGKTLTIDIDDAGECDLTVAQLVISAQKSVAAHGAKLKLAKPAAGNFLAVIERMGLLTGDKKQDGFWLEGKAI